MEGQRERLAVPGMGCFQKAIAVQNALSKHDFTVGTIRIERPGKR
jgi:hypothetical protein